MIDLKSSKVTAKSIWISDVHLGSTGTKEECLHDFLNNITCSTLFLNGDIIDRWLLRNSNKFELSLKNLTLQLEKIQNKGTQIIFLPGNHDNLHDIQAYFPNFKCVSEYQYKTVKNKNYLIFHGDKLDYSVNVRKSFLAQFGTYIYEYFLKRRKINKSESFSRKLKVATKNVFYFVFRYYYFLYRYLKKHNYDGVICGHSHQPGISKLKSKDYLNSGDWIDNCTFLMETSSGEFKLHRWGGANS